MQAPCYHVFTCDITETCAVRPHLGYYTASTTNMILQLAAPLFSKTGAFSKLSSSHKIEFRSICRGGGAVAMQAPTDTQMRDITFSLNKAETLGGAVYMYGSLGNNTLRVYKTFRFQGNTANSVRQDIAVSSSGVISFDEVPTGASSVIGTGVDGFEWNPAENSNMNSNLSVLYDASTGSTAEDFPKLLERTESWIVDAEQVCVNLLIHKCLFLSYSPVSLYRSGW